MTDVINGARSGGYNHGMIHATTSKSIRRVLLLALLAFSPMIASAGEWEVRPDSRFRLEGDSTLHPYHSTATVVHVSGGWSADAAGNPFDKLAAGALSAFELRVPVAEMKSGKNGLDKNLRKELKAGDHPDIVFRLSGYDVETSTAGVVVRARGALSVAGVDREETITAEARPTPGGLRLTGAKDLKMSDFGIDPPRMMLGAIRTADAVTIHYDLFLVPDGRDEK